MRGAVTGLFLIGLVVMGYFGRSNILSGGGVLSPHLSATVAKTEAGMVLRLTNSGTVAVRKITLATDRWNLDRRRPACAELAPGAVALVPLDDATAGKGVYFFAEGYLLPAWFETAYVAE